MTFVIISHYFCLYFVQVEEEEHETFDKLVSMLPEIHEESKSLE